MIRTLVLAIALCSAAVVGAGETSDPGVQFDARFEDGMLRLDFSHTVTRTLDLMSLDRLHVQGSWSGPRRLASGPAALGSYRLDVTDTIDSGTLLFSRGWDSIAAEYRSTAAAKVPIARTFQETVLIPMPKHPVVLTVRRIGDDGEKRIFERTVDPSDLTIARSKPASNVTVVEHRVAGPPQEFLDILLLGEGYSATDETTFRRDLAHFADLLLSHEPFAALADHISIRGAWRPSRDSGCDEPTRGVWAETALGASFNALGSPRYLLTEDEWALRDVAAAAPYDALIVMVNHDRYGGGGLYNTWCTFTAHGAWSDYLLLHEFGHSFAGLADEYYTSSVAYEDLLPAGVEPSAPNVTALLDPAQLKWSHLVAEDTPLPTPWPKEAYDHRDLAYQEDRRALDAAVASASRRGDSVEARRIASQLEELTFRHVRAMKALLAEAPFSGTVGAFEGGGYASTGLYRPSQDCLMFTRGVQPWCPVCRTAVEAAIRSYME